MHKVLLATAIVSVACAFNSAISEMIDTVLIETEAGPIRINTHEFDDATMKLADVPAPITDGAVKTAPVEMLVGKEGTGAKTRYFVNDASGNRIDAPGIDANGYDDEAGAWVAIMAIKAN